MTRQANGKGPRLRAAVIGSGRISHEHLQYLSTASGVEVVAVCDLSPGLANYAVAKFGAGRAFTSTADMLRELKPDVVHVLTPSPTHVSIAADCINAGAHVIVEKPAAPTSREFNQLWSLARSRNRWLVEDHNYRFNQPVLQIERLLTDGRLRELREVEVRMALSILDDDSRFVDPNLPHPAHAMPAGLIHDFITHLCYLTLRFMPRYDRIRAVWSKYGKDKQIKYDDLDAILVGDQIHARIRFTAHAAPEEFTVTLRGAKGWAEANLFHPRVRSSVERTIGFNQVLGGNAQQKTHFDGVTTFLDRTYAALNSGKEPPVSFDDMDRTSKLADALLSEQNRM